MARNQGRGAASTQAVMSRLREIDAVPRRLARSKFDLNANTPGEESIVAEYRTERPLFLDHTRDVEIIVTAYEEFTTAGDGSTQTFDLDHELVDSPNYPTGPSGDDLVLYADGEYVEPVSIDYEADQFDYEDDGTQQTLDAFYVAGDPGTVKIRKTAPSAVYEDVVTLNTKRSNVRNQDDDPIRFDLADPIEGVVPRKWKVQVILEVPYSVQWEGEGDADAINFLANLPIREGSEPVDGLDQVARSHAAQR